MGPAQAIDWRRHPADLARLVAVALVLGVVLVLTAVEPGALTDLSDDLVDAVRRLPASARGLVAGTLQVVAFVLPVVGVVWAAIRRSWRPLAEALVALVVAAVPMALLTDWLDRAAPPQVRATAEADSWLTGQAFPSAAYLAALSAVVTAVSPLLHRRWRRTLWFLVGLAAFLRMTTAAAVPVNVAIAVLMGVAAGSAVLLALGGPGPAPRPRGHPPGPGPCRPGPGPPGGAPVGWPPGVRGPTSGGAPGPRQLRRPGRARCRPPLPRLAAAAGQGDRGSGG